MSLFVNIYLDLRLALFSAHSSFSWIYARSDFLCSLKHGVLTDGYVRFFPAYLRLFPGKIWLQIP